MVSINFKDLMIYGLQFVKEKFLVIYGEINKILPGPAPITEVVPYTLIKYYTHEQKKNYNVHIFDGLHSCVRENTKIDNP